MTVLGIETSTRVCAAAVARGDRVLSERIVDERYIHAERLMGMVDEVVREGKISLDGIRVIAVSIGPGSFTGLRIGLSVAKGLGFAMDKPLIGVPTLRALAERVVRAEGSSDARFICPVLESRRDEVYCQLFRRQGSSLEPVWEERDMTAGELFKTLRDTTVVVTGEGAGRIRNLVAGGAAGGISFAPPDIARCSAGIVALLGGAMYDAGERADARTLEPRYINEFFTRVKE